LSMIKWEMPYPEITRVLTRLQSIEIVMGMC